MDIKAFLKKNNLQEGNQVEIIQGNLTMIGNILPSSGDILEVKLKTGYDTGIKIDNITSIKKIGEGKKVQKAEAKEFSKNPSLPTVSIILTGGTIVSRIDYSTGAVVASIDPKDLITMYPEITELANVEYERVSEIMSEDMRFSHYEKLGKAIEKAINSGSKGIIIPHGTDTLHYTSAALAFMLENCPIPVLLVGSQRSSDRGSSDAASNLISAVQFITQSDFAGVGVCMHEGSSDNQIAIFPACKVRKLHSSRRDAFRPVNDQVIARVNYFTKKIEFLKEDYSRKKGDFKLHNQFEDKVALVKTHTNMHPEQFSFYKKSKYKGLVIEGTGLGHAPINVKENDGKFVKTISELAKSMVVVMCTQTIYGSTQMHVYSPGRKWLEIGVLEGKDMLPETAFIKLAWLLGNYKKKEDVKRLFSENLRGEFNPRLPLKDSSME